jgi:hypothetical protein
MACTVFFNKDSNMSRKYVNFLLRLWNQELSRCILFPFDHAASYVVYIKPLLQFFLFCNVFYITYRLQNVILGVPVEVAKLTDVIKR